MERSAGSWLYVLKPTRSKVNSDTPNSLSLVNNDMYIEGESRLLTTADWGLLHIINYGCATLLVYQRKGKENISGLPILNYNQYVVIFM